MPNTGGYWLAGGKWWEDIWNFQQGSAVVQLADVLSDPVLGPNSLPEDPIQAAEAVVEAAATERSAPGAVVGRLLDLDWQPPVTAPEGTQIWTITGTPAKVHHMNGTQAYLSLPKGPDWLRYEDRGDIVLDNPVVTVVNERLSN